VPPRCVNSRGPARKGWCGLKKGVSVDDLAARAGIDAEQINAIEDGRLDPAFDVMIALAEGIGVRLSALIPKD
jgi:transcriptional regulator with XRE-family HTH domain